LAQPSKDGRDFFDARNVLRRRLAIPRSPEGCQANDQYGKREWHKFGLFDHPESLRSVVFSHLIRSNAVTLPTHSRRLLNAEGLLHALDAARSGAKGRKLLNAISDCGIVRRVPDALARTGSNNTVYPMS